MSWLGRLFGSGDADRVDDEPDPESVVWVATVALWQAPLIVHGLEEQRIKAVFAETSSRRLTLGGAPAARIYVHQRHRAEAEEIIVDLTSTAAPEPSDESGPAD